MAVPVQETTRTLPWDRVGRGSRGFGAHCASQVSTKMILRLGKSLEWRPEGLEELVLMLDVPSRIQMSCRCVSRESGGGGLGVCNTFAGAANGDQPCVRLDHRLLPDRIRNGCKFARIRASVASV